MNRPPIGFIVEGHGEYNCYPSLLSKIVNANGFNVPRVNAGGCGSIIRRLPEQLDDMLSANSPENIIITVDLMDVLHQRLAADLDDLINLINSEIEKWKLVAKDNLKIHPLPERIVFIAQVKKFEAWLLSDLEGLKNAKLINSKAEEILSPDDFKDPAIWFKKNLLNKGDVKCPQFAKKLTTAVNPEKMRLCSPSFGRFFDECQTMYAAWEMKLQ